MVGELRQVDLAAEDALAELAVPAGIALLDQLGELAALDHRGGEQKAAGADIHAADMGVEEVGGIDALTTDLGVEIDAAGPEAAVLEAHVERQRGLADIVRQLVGVPAV